MSRESETKCGLTVPLLAVALVRPRTNNDAMIEPDFCGEDKIHVTVMSRSVFLSGTSNKMYMLSSSARIPVRNKPIVQEPGSSPQGSNGL